MKIWLTILLVLLATNLWAQGTIELSEKILVATPWVNSTEIKGVGSFHFRLEANLKTSLKAKTMRLAIGTQCEDENCIIGEAKKMEARYVVSSSIQSQSGTLWITSHMIDVENGQRISTAQWKSNDNLTQSAELAANEVTALLLNKHSSKSQNSYLKWLAWGAFGVALISMPIVGYLGSQVDTIRTTRTVRFE